VNRLVRFAMVALFPREEPLPGVEDLDLDAKIAAFRRESAPLLWLGVVGGAILFQVAPLVTLRKPLLASWLSAEDLDRHAFRLAGHPFYLVRQLMFLLKMMGGIFWAQSDIVRASIHLPAYGADPGTRRVERHVALPEFPPYEPAPLLLALGRHERERGRGSTPRGHA
jgi:hypothetical protein